jgi:phosphomevalonate kinase
MYTPTKVELHAIKYKHNDANKDFQKMKTNNNYKKAIFIYNDEKVTEHYKRNGSDGKLNIMGILLENNKNNRRKKKDRLIARVPGGLDFSSLDNNVGSRKVRDIIDAAIKEIRVLIMHYKFEHVYYYINDDNRVCTVLPPGGSGGGGISVLPNSNVIDYINTQMKSLKKP